MPRSPSQHNEQKNAAVNAATAVITWFRFRAKQSLLIFFTNWKMQRTKLNLEISLVAVVQWTSEAGKIEVLSLARFSWPRVRPPSSGADGSWPSWRRSASGRRDSWEAASPTGTTRRKRFSQRLWKSKKSLTQGAPRSQKKISLEHVFRLLN